MKKNIALSTLCILAAILFSSCGTHWSITKRHYNKGYYVSHTTGNQLVTKPAEKRSITDKTNPALYTIPMMDESSLNGYSVQIPVNSKGPFTASRKKVQHAQVSDQKPKKVSSKRITLNKYTSLQNRYTDLRAKKLVSDSERDGLSLFWLIILVILILWAIGFIAGGFGLGGLINLLLLIALILLILWLLRIV